MTYLHRQYQTEDRDGCLSIFDEGSPEFFAPNERVDYERFLDGVPAGYEVSLLDGTIVGASGTWVDEDLRRGRLCWILIASTGRGSGLGTVMMARAIRQLQVAGATMMDIAASQKSAPFFERFGAKERRRTPEGWGVGLDRIDMELAVPSP